MSSCKCRRNVYMLAFAFLCNFTSYMTLESMQSSLNRSTGTTALCLLYTSLVLSSLLLPPLAIAKLDCRKSLSLSMSMYAIYALANFYPVPYVLIPAAILLGTGASIMWACAFYYVMQLAQKHAKEKSKSVEEVTGDFFGKFTSLSHISILIGTLFMSVVFESLQSEEQSITNNSTQHETVASTWDWTSNLPNRQPHFRTENSLVTSMIVHPTRTSDIQAATDMTCGPYYKLSEGPTENKKSISDVVMYVLLSVYLAFNVLAAGLCLCLEEITGLETKTAQVDDAVCASMSSLNGQSGRIEVKDKNGEVENKEFILDQKDDTRATHQQEVIEDDRSVTKLIKSAIKLAFTDKAAVLLIPFTLHYGMIQGFVRGAFNASWISCALGIKYVAYVTCVYGAVMILGCFTFGKLVQLMTHAKIFLITMSFEVLLFVVTLIWHPSQDPSSEIWIFFLIPIGFGICHSSLSSQLGSVYSRFFEKNKKAGTALLGVWNPMGSAIAYGLGGALYPVHLAALVLCTCVVGTALYLVAETIKDKSYRKCKNGCVKW